MRPTTETDAALVSRAREGSERAAEELFRRHWPAVWKAAYAVAGRRELADEIAQEAFVQAFGAMDQFDTRRPLGPWLKAIVVNRAIDCVRRERRSTAVAERRLSAVPTGMVAADPPARDERAAREEAAEILEAVRGLSEDKRLVLVLHFWLDYSIGQIAEALGLPSGTVASRLSRGLAELRPELEAARVKSA